MQMRPFVFAAVLLPVVLSSAGAQEPPVATAPIPPPVKAAPDTPVVVPTKPNPRLFAPAAPAAHPATLPRQSPVAAHPTPKPGTAVKEADRKKGKQPSEHAARTFAKAESKTEKKPDKPDKKVATNTPPPRTRTVVRRRWIVREERRWAPPPPFGPSWYEREGRGPLAYAPYPGSGMRVPPPPMPWDE